MSLGMENRRSFFAAVKLWHSKSSAQRNLLLSQIYRGTCCRRAP